MPTACGLALLAHTAEGAQLLSDYANCAYFLFNRHDSGVNRQQNNFRWYATRNKLPPKVRPPS